MCVYMYVCIYIYIYICAYIHTYIHMYMYSTCVCIQQYGILCHDTIYDMNI